MLPFLLLARTPVEPDKYSDETEDTALQSTDTSTFDDDTADTEDTEVDTVDTGSEDTDDTDTDAEPCNPDAIGIGLPVVSNPTFTVTVQEGEPFLTDLVDQDIFFSPMELSFLRTRTVGGVSSCRQ